MPKGCCGHSSRRPAEDAPVRVPRHKIEQPPVSESEHKSEKTAEPKLENKNKKESVSEITSSTPETSPIPTDAVEEPDEDTENSTDNLISSAESSGGESREPIGIGSIHVQQRLAGTVAAPSWRRLGIENIESPSFIVQQLAPEEEDDNDEYKRGEVDEDEEEGGSKGLPRDSITDFSRLSEESEETRPSLLVPNTPGDVRAFLPPSRGTKRSVGEMVFTDREDIRRQRRGE